MEIIYHRCILNSNKIEYFDFLYNSGIFSYEIDLFYYDKRGVAVGHPLHSDEFECGINFIHKLSVWTIGKKVKIYFDIKYPETWDIPDLYFLKILCAFEKGKVFLISYDIEYFSPKNMIDKSYLYHVINKITHASSSHSVVLPIKEIEKKPDIISYLSGIIASEVNSNFELCLSKKYKLKKIMSDVPNKLIPYL